MKWLARFGLLFLLLVAFLLGAAAWLVGTEAGLRWALERAEAAAGGKLTLEGVSGVLAGTIAIERLTYEGSGFKLETRRLSARADLLAALAGRLAIEPLQAESVEIALRAGGAERAAPPSLPFGVALADVALERLEVAREGQHYALREVRLTRLELDRALSAEGSFSRPHERFPAQASFRLQGSLERLELFTQLSIAEVPVKARAILRPFEAQRIEALEARAGPVDLSRFDAALPRTAISASVEAKAAAGRGLEGMLSAANAAHGPIDAARLPVARIETRFSSTDLASATLERLRIVVSGGGTLEGRAAVDPASLRAELRASGVDLRSLRSSLRATRLAGPLQLRLTRNEQVLSGRLSQDDVSVEAELARSGDVVDIRSLRAAAAGGELSGAGKLHLESLRFEAKLTLAALNPAAFGDYPEGSLNGSLLASGRLGGEYQVDATWTVRESSLLGRPLESRGSARISPERITRAQARASFGASSAGVRGDFGRPGDELAWRLEVPQLAELAPAAAGRLEASGTLSGRWSDPEAAGAARVAMLRLPGGLQAAELSAKFKGRLSRHDLALSATAPDIALQARLRGGWDPARGWSGELLSLANAGTYPLQSLASTRLQVSRKHLELGRLEARLGAGRLLVSGLRWQPGRLSSSGEFTGLPAQWLLAASGLAQRAAATLLLDGAWSLAAAPRLEGTLTLRRASGDLSIDGAALELQSASIEGRFADGRLLAEARVASRFGTAALEGRVAPVPGAAGLGFGRASPLSFRARAELAAIRTLAQPYLDEARLDGRLSAEIAGSGTLGEPSISGELAGEAIRFEMPPYGVFLRNGELRAVLEGNALRIVALSIQAGEGRLTASGTLPLKLAERSARLEWQARNFTVVERPDMRLVASGKGEAQFDGKRVSLVGDLRADRGYLQLERERLPQLGEDVVIVGEPREERGKRLRLPVALDLLLDLGEELTVRAQGFEGKLAGRVQVQTNKEGELRAYGRLHAVNATFLAYGQRLEVDPGVLIFDGPIDNPSLQVTAWRRNQAVEAGVQISGTARAPRVQLVSQPPVPEGERLSWLVLGRAPSDATQADLGLLQAAAGALLARGDGMPLDRRLARSVGLDEISLRGTGEVQERVVAFGKRLSERVYVSYERGIGVLATNLVKLDYALSRRWSVRAETGSMSSGGTTSGWGLFYRFSWD